MKEVATSIVPFRPHATACAKFAHLGLMQRGSKKSEAHCREEELDWMKILLLRNSSLRASGELVGP